MRANRHTLFPKATFQIQGLGRFRRTVKERPIQGTPRAASSAAGKPRREQRDRLRHIKEDRDTALKILDGLSGSEVYEAAGNSPKKNEALLVDFHKAVRILRKVNNLLPASETLGNIQAQAVPAAANSIFANSAAVVAQAALKRVTSDAPLGRGDVENISAAMKGIELAHKHASTKPANVDVTMAMVSASRKLVIPKWAEIFDQKLEALDSQKIDSRGVDMRKVGIAATRLQRTAETFIQALASKHVKDAERETSDVADGNIYDDKMARRQTARKRERINAVARKPAYPDADVYEKLQRIAVACLDFISAYNEALRNGATPERLSVRQGPILQATILVPVALETLAGSSYSAFAGKPTHIATTAMSQFLDRFPGRPANEDMRGPSATGSALRT